MLLKVLDSSVDVLLILTQIGSFLNVILEVLSLLCAVFMNRKIFCCS